MSPSKVDGYLATPAANKGSPVLVLHAWWGLNDTIKALCDRLAAAGFLAFAPDLYHGKVTDQIAEAEKLGGALDQKVDEARAELLDAAKFIKERAGSEYPGVAVIGFSLGAFYALDLSARAPELIRSVVVFYGSGPADFGKAKADYLGHFAEQDQYEPKDNVDGLEKDIRDAGRSVTFYTYPNTGHWFFEPDRDVYNEVAANLAWDRTLTFLKRFSTP